MTAHMPILAILALPTLFASAAVLLAHRRISHPLLFFVLAVFTLCGLSETAYYYIGDYFVQSSPPVPAERLGAEASALIVANAVSALVGGVVLWRLALALRKR